VVPVSFGYDGRCALRGYPFEVALSEGMPIAGVVLDDQQTRTLDWRARRGRWRQRRRPTSSPR
jgi:mRNA-degrading endonuclease toxin of MazEF toxin-antitoxin module